MGKIKDDSTRVILRNLLILLPAFYGQYYFLAIILTAGFHAPWSHLGYLPFDWEQFYFTAGAPLAGWLALVLNFLLAVVHIFFIVRSTKNSWDYAVSLGIIHFILTCIVSRRFPLNWIWWVTIILTDVLLVVASELSTYFLSDLRAIDVNHT
ncbi:hypothetical protein PROFUN_09030 [Planoprotostelium fungivorum]|uniref:Uncharacterized protein n=1 Tax=Planoprotostelium fungivorum TaxID=1890364 RepID=A0A2P6MV25_9EUKA|nr:hypothetical protein PROFUN_09030 [Planoprotostelium fungivorum]